MLKKFIITIGLPRSGKTTWAIKQGVPVVNPDAIRIAIHGQPFVRTAERFVWATAYTMVYSLFEAGHDVVILDATNLTEEMRKIAVKEAHERMGDGVQVVAKIFKTSPEECCRRALATNKPFLVSVIQKMANQIEYSTELQEIENVGGAQ